MILYGIKQVKLTELDAASGLPKQQAQAILLKTAEEADLSPVFSEGSEEILRSSEQILAIVREDDLLYGYDITFKDNTFDEKCAELVCGYVPKDSGKGLVTPKLKDGNVAKPFKLEIWVKQVEGDAVVGYVKITLNKCFGKFATMKVGKEFYAPEFAIKARENSAADLPIKELDFVDNLE